MARSLLSFALILIILASIVSSRELLPRKENGNEGPPDALVSAVEDLDGFGEMPLDGRSLIESWLHKRQYTCNRADYSPCADGSGCCPSTGKCCRTGCARRVTDRCCVGGGTCPSGWGCCESGTCYPLGGQCCSGGRYCTPGNYCYRYRGRPVCCSDSSCTGYVSSGTTVTLEGGYNSLDGSAPATTFAPTSSIAVYRYYYYTITWYYVSWYWTFIQSSTSTSTTVTTTTTISIYASNTYAAARSFSILSESVASSTPSDASTLDPLDTRTSSSPFAEGTDVTPVVTVTAPNPTSFDGASVVTVSAVSTSSVNGAAMGMRNGGSADLSILWITASLVALWVGGGALVIWL